MHKKFDSAQIEKKWQQEWKESGIYNTESKSDSNDKEYVLVEWPYPSGNLHIGHWHAFSVPDIYVRFQRMMGKQVLFPIGFDAFGLPAENAAIKRDINPCEWTESNIAHMREQLESMGNAFSWDMTTSSTDPEYYKWTQWMFTKFFENGVAYRGKGKVNWCPGCNTVIANEQVLSDDTCERCGHAIEKREMPQWMLRITNYADRLVDDLDHLDWPEHIKEAQRHWIGRSQGAILPFKLNCWTSDVQQLEVEVFTTRPDTLYGATYLVLAPEHGLLHKIKDSITNWQEVNEYIDKSKKKAEQDRLDDSKEKTGVRLEGVTATNPGSGEEIPVYIADYVLASYGTGAIMAVPAHDERDGDFARKFDLPVRQVVAPFYRAEGADAPREDLETLERPCIDIIIEHPTGGTFLVQKEQDGDRTLVHFVGGGTDGEDDEVAVARELLEETGLSKFKLISEKPVFTTKSVGYRHSKNKNQQGVSNFYHIKLTDLEQVDSEIEDGKHTIEWLNKEEVSKQINWSWHRRAWEAFLGDKVSVTEGVLTNSGKFDGMNSEEAKEKIVKKVGGRMTNTYRLRDWSVGRQRYWGVPIPIVYDPEGKAHSVPEEHLPWLLPEDVDFKPTGEAPLAKSEELKKRTEEIFGADWTPEVETLDTFVDSSWYFLRYLDTENNTSLSDKNRQEDWMPVDIYFGGAEHTTMHLLYSRFWQKALFDMDLVMHKEPYKKRINRGLILGPDGNKMSKSKGNVIDPDEQVAKVGADTVKMYLAFMGPYAETANYPWDMGGIAGIRRFLERVNGLNEHLTEKESDAVRSELHRVIKKLRRDIPEYKFNTAISSMMSFLNLAEKNGLSRKSYLIFLKLLAPFAPHLCEELWSQAGHNTSVHIEEYPEFDSSLTTKTEVTIGVQINGKHKGEITLSPDANEQKAVALLKANVELMSKLDGEEIRKIIYKPGKILNLIV
ncbi:leucine--tRNA ligase [bacterium]|nr:leucine--tRNA ligase [bacterium]